MATCLLDSSVSSKDQQPLHKVLSLCCVKQNICTGRLQSKRLLGLPTDYLHSEHVEGSLFHMVCINCAQLRNSHAPKWQVWHSSFLTQSRKLHQHAILLASKCLGAELFLFLFTGVGGIHAACGRIHKDTSCNSLRVRVTSYMADTSLLHAAKTPQMSSHHFGLLEYIQTQRTTFDWHNAVFEVDGLYLWRCHAQPRLLPTLMTQTLFATCHACGSDLRVWSDASFHE